MLRLGEIQLSADAVINFTTTQLADNQPLAPEGVFDEAAGGGRLYERAYEALKKWDAVINRPLNITRGEGDPALGGTWTVPPHNAPSGETAAGWLMAYQGSSRHRGVKSALLLNCNLALGPAVKGGGLHRVKRGNLGVCCAVVSRRHCLDLHARWCRCCQQQALNVVCST